MPRKITFRIEDTTHFTEIKSWEFIFTLYCLRLFLFGESAVRGFKLLALCGDLRKNTRCNDNMDYSIIQMEFLIRHGITIGDVYPDDIMGFCKRWIDFTMNGQIRRQFRKYLYTGKATTLHNDSTSSSLMFLFLLSVWYQTEKTLRPNTLSMCCITTM